MNVQERFWSKVDRQGPDECWPWLASTNDKGYGQFSAPDVLRGHTAHRYAYTTMRGPIPDGLQIDHLCRNRACVNPAHLEPVTSRENTMRSPVARASINASKTHCKNGHELVGDNLLNRPGRRCKECRRAWDRSHWDPSQRRRHR